MLKRLAILLVVSVLIGGCAQIQRPSVEPFYAANPPPPRQELRWSNGRMSKSADPARAVSAPETDIVRAIYEGLTDLDSKTLTETPGVAERWESPDSGRTWTFHLRKQARWSNGERVTAADFVRAWQRLPERASTPHLYRNIAGMGPSTISAPRNDADAFDLLSPGPSTEREVTPAEPSPSPEIDRSDDEDQPRMMQDVGDGSAGVGLEAVDDQTLRVRLDVPDMEFPRLVAHPIFRPLHREAAKLESVQLDVGVVTNGPFRIVSISDDGITVERSDNYWDRGSVTLERIHFRAAKTPEAALEAYRMGEIDVLTNAAFTSAGLKLLAPYNDFRRTTHSALNLYEVNMGHAPFNDRRVREALAIAIDRERLTLADLGGTVAPAPSLLPLNRARGESLSFDVERARELLANAGYPDGTGFPTVRLVVNRNDVQQRVARSVARMWKSNLNIETSVIVLEFTEMDALRATGDFDLIRRGVVLPANDELVALQAVFDRLVNDQRKNASKPEAPGSAAEPTPDAAGTPSDTRAQQPLSTGSQTLHDFRVIPLYFPLSYSLVKPYVEGYELNALDTPSLKDVRINSEWRPERSR